MMHSTYLPYYLKQTCAQLLELTIFMHLCKWIKQPD